MRSSSSQPGVGERVWISSETGNLEAGRHCQTVWPGKTVLTPALHAFQTQNLGSGALALCLYDSPAPIIASQPGRPSEDPMLSDQMPSPVCGQKPGGGGAGGSPSQAKLLHVSPRATAFLITLRSCLCLPLLCFLTLLKVGCFAPSPVPSLISE